MDWPSMSPDLNLIEHLLGILKWKVDGVEERKVSNIHQLRDVITEEWKWRRTAMFHCENSFLWVERLFLLSLQTQATSLWPNNFSFVSSDQRTRFSRLSFKLQSSLEVCLVFFLVIILLTAVLDT